MTAKEFASMLNTTVRTIKYYEEIGLFHPIQVKENGYRYYHVTQIDDFKSIQVLQECGMRLEEIKEYLNKPSFEKKMEILDLQKERLERRMEENKKTCELVRTEQQMMKLAEKYKMEHAQLVSLPFQTYDLREYENQDVVVIKTFSGHSVHGVYARTEKKIGVFQIFLSTQSGEYSFQGDKFLLYFYEGHPSRFDIHLVTLKEEIRKQKFRICSPFFNSALYEGKDEYCISFLLVNVEQN